MRKTYTNQEEVIETPRSSTVTWPKYFCDKSCFAQQTIKDYSQKKVKKKLNSFLKNVYTSFTDPTESKYAADPLSL